MHLAAGLAAGISIGIMCFTGAALAFEKDIVAWSEADARRVIPPAADAPRLPLAELTRKVAEAKPDARPSGITVASDPGAAVAFAFGRDGALYANPYTGEVRAPASTRVHDFMHLLEDWHRVLALGGDNRPIGKAINGACNVVFLFLSLSGLWLWWPRSWSWAGFKAVAVLNRGLTGKARDFNWHNSIGLWSAPILVVLTLTAMPISYRWAGNIVYHLVGEEPPVGPGPTGTGTDAREIPHPSPGARPLDHDALLAGVQRQCADWESITFRLAIPQRGGGQPTRPPGKSGAPPSPSREGGFQGVERRRAPQPVTVIVKESGSWPRTAATTLTLDPFTGETLKTEAFADLGTGRQIRSWMRFLHTGEALGWLGQLVAGLSCLGGCFLVYTGFALSWRRFFYRKSPVSPHPAR